MIRKIGEFTASEDIEQDVEWEITSKRSGKPMLRGRRTITKSGAIKVTKQGETYPGLKPLTGFEVDPRTLELRAIPDSQMPLYPRGWGMKGFAADDPEFTKLEDKK